VAFPLRAAGTNACRVPVLALRRWSPPLRVFGASSLSAPLLVSWLRSPAGRLRTFCMCAWALFSLSLEVGMALHGDGGGCPTSSAPSAKLQHWSLRQSFLPQSGLLLGLIERRNLQGARSSFHEAR